jgi:hypothetical protein
MLQNFILTILLFLISGIFGYVIGQTTPESGIKPSVIIGDVTVIDASKIVITTKDGSVQANLSAKTEFKRVSPDNPSLKAAVAAAASDIGVGDRVVVTGVLAENKKSLPARTIFLMTKSDISQKRAKEAEAWKTRGIAGRVTAVNTQTNQFTVEIRTLTGSTSTVVTPKEAAKFRRYAPDSVKFDEATVSTLAEIKNGDMVRALGDKSSDGTSFTAEEVVSGAFQTIAGTVKSVDVEKNEVVITDVQTKKDVTVSLAGASVLKKFPAEMAERFAGMQAGGGMRPPGAGGDRPAGERPAGDRPVGDRPAGDRQGTPGGGGRGFGGRSGGIDDMLDRFPNITAADLKTGDMIAVSSSKNGNATRINAIKLLAGVEPFIRMAQVSAGGRGGRGGRNSGVDTGFSIPGMDGIGFP